MVVPRIFSSYCRMVWLVALAACHTASGNRDAGLSTGSSSTGFSISLQRLPGPHQRPAYTLSIDEHSQATYVGGQNAPKKGTFYRILTSDEANALVTACRAMDWSAQAKQLTSKNLDVQASVLTYTESGGQPYKITFKDQLPPALRTVERVMDSIGRAGEWAAEKR